MSLVPKPSVRIAAFVVIALMACGCGRAKAQTFTPYSQFQSMTLAQLDGLQAKLTIIGPQLTASSSVAFVAIGHTFDPNNFVSHYRAEFKATYVGDIMQPRTFSATTQQLKALIDSVGTLPGVTDGGVDSTGFVSFSLMNKIGPDTLVFEAIVDTGNGRKLFTKMLQALSANASAVTTLSGFACATDLVPLAAPRDASADVTTRLTGVRVDRQTGQYVGTVRVTNTSLLPLMPPLILILRAEGNVDLANADGRTCRIFPAQAGYLTLPIGTSLLPTAHVDVTARFTNPDKEPIKFVFIRVFQGQGTR